VVIGEGCVATFPYDHGKTQRPQTQPLTKLVSVFSRLHCKILTVSVIKRPEHCISIAI
jgi:hypothetical protein